MAWREERMISTPQILAAALITGLAVFAAAETVSWPRLYSSVAALGSFGLIVAWRAVANLKGLNGDYIPAISVGDTGCLLVGAIIPFGVLLSRRLPDSRRWVPAVVGGAVAFVVDVVIL
jgi:hypothetical protein